MASVIYTVAASRVAEPERRSVLSQAGTSRLSPWRTETVLTSACPEIHTIRTNEVVWRSTVRSPLFLII